MTTPIFFSERNKDLIEFRAKELIRKIFMKYPLTLEMQNDYEFIRDYGSPELSELVETICSVRRTME